MNEFDFKGYPYYFAVDYIENGEENFDTWSAATLNLELNRNDVKIVHIELAYNVQVALGLITED